MSDHIDTTAGLTEGEVTPSLNAGLMQQLRSNIQRSIFAALTHVKPDYRSPRRIDDAASVITDFVMPEVEAALAVAPPDLSEAAPNTEGR